MEIKWGETEKSETADLTERDRTSQRQIERRIKVPRAVFSAVWMAEQVHQSRNFQLAHTKSRNTHTRSALPDQHHDWSEGSAEGEPHLSTPHVCKVCSNGRMSSVKLLTGASHSGLPIDFLRWLSAHIKMKLLADVRLVWRGLMKVHFSKSLLEICPRSSKCSQS